MKEALIFLACVVCLIEACKFPKYLQSASVWVTNYQDGNDFKAYFKGNIIEASKCNPLGTCREYKLRCLSSITEDKFEVEYSDKDDNSPYHYLCMQFIRRTDSIIQIKESDKLNFPNPDACNKLLLDNWPLVSSDNFYKQRVKCPFEGGYNIEMQKSNSQLLCPSRLIPPRLESECENGDGITIDFRSKECLDLRLDMDLKQSLYCAATWTHGKYTFVIIRPQAEEFKAWCLRIEGTGDLRHIREGDLFLDFVCDPGDGSGHIYETSNYLHLSFEMHIVNTICADQSEVCDENRLCEHEVGFYCPKACRRCSGELRPCSFPEKFGGNWLDISGGKQQHVNISSYALSISNAGRFQCLEKEGHDFTNGSVMFQTFDNGCFPRFACLELTKPSAVTLSYRMSNRLHWPVKSLDNLEGLKQDVCDKDNFKINMFEKQIYGKQIDEKPMHILIDPLHHFSQHCQLDEWTGFENKHLYAKEDGVCDMCLVYDVKDHSDKIMQVPLNCTANKHDYKQRDFKCIAKFPVDEHTHAVVTRTLHVHEQFFCWIFINDRNIFNGLGRVFIVDPSHCNLAAIESLKNGILTPKHTYILPGSPKPCPYIGDVVPITPDPKKVTPPTKFSSTNAPKSHSYKGENSKPGPIYHEYTTPQSFQSGNSLGGGETSVHKNIEILVLAFMINLIMTIL